MNLILLRLNLKNNLFLLLIFCGVMSMYLSMMIYMYDPTSVSSLTDMMDMLPADMIAAMGFDTIATDLTGFIAGFYYGFLVFAFPMIYCILLAHKLVAKMVDNGSFAYLLQTPISRRTIIITQGSYLLLSILILFSVVFIVGVSISNSMFYGMLNVSSYFRLHFSAMLLTMTIAMICFFYSCLFHDGRKALAFGAGVPISFFLLYLFGGVSEDAEIFKDMSIYSLLDAPAIVDNGNTIGINLLFLAIIVGLFLMSLIIFDKKRLPL